MHGTIDPNTIIIELPTRIRVSPLFNGFRSDDNLNNAS